MAIIILAEQSSTPSTPDTGDWKLYPKSDGWYSLDDAGNESPIGGIVDAADVTYTPTTSADWDVEPSTALEAFDELANRVTNIEDAPTGGEWVAGTGTWSYSSADSPTFVISVNNNQTGIIGVGMRIKVTQTTVKYFIVTAVGSYSGGATLITVYGGTDYTLANAAISSPYISGYKAPLGFPMSPTKWTVTVTDSSERTQAGATQNTWYNLGSISISVPIGAWILGYKAGLSQNTSGSYDVQITLSTANNSASDSDFTNLYAPMAQYVVLPMQYSKPVLLASKTSYYINTRHISAATIILVNPNNKIGLVLSAICAYL